MPRREWWNDLEVETVDIKRTRFRGIASSGIRISVHSGSDEQDPVLQVATVWNPGDGDGGDK